MKRYQKYFAFQLMVCCIFSAFQLNAVRSKEALLNLKIDSVIVGGCGEGALYGATHPETAITINIDSEANADLTCNAFEENEDTEWLKQHYSQKIKHVSFEHVGDLSFVDYLEDQWSAKPWQLIDPLYESEATDASQGVSIDMSGFIEGTVEYEQARDEKLNQIEVKFSKCVFDLLQDINAQKQRPKFMKIVSLYSDLLEPGGSFEWTSSVNPESFLKKRDETYINSVFECNKIFFRDALGLTNITTELIEEKESYSVYAPPSYYEDLKEIDGEKKYSFRVMGLKGNRKTEDES